VPKPKVTILREKTSGDYLLVHYALHPKIGASIGWGLRDRYTPDTFRKSGLDAVLKSLHDYHSRKNADKQINVYRVSGPKGSIDDAKAHLSLGVRMDMPSELTISPMHREGGGYVGSRDEETQLELPVTPEEFLREVDRAFEKCS
jgi:hypothetical protein